MWKGERKESSCFSHRWLQESHGHSRPPCFYHSLDARKKNLNPLGSAALFTGKACALPSLPFWEYECRCSWKASKYLVHRGKSLRLNFRAVTEEWNSKKQQMRRNMGFCTDPSVIFTHILYHLIRADDTTLVAIVWSVLMPRWEMGSSVLDTQKYRRSKNHQCHLK